MQKFLAICCLVLVVGILVQGRLYRRCLVENRRLKDNQDTLFSEAVFYRTRDSLSAAGVERLTLSNREFSRYSKVLKEEIRSLNLKMKRLKSVGRTATETQYRVETVIRDSILPGRTDTLKCIDFRNEYLTLSGCVESNIFTGLIESRDTLVQMIHRIPRKFWFLRWGTKAIRQEVVCKNPYSRIAYTEYIELKK